MSPIDMAARRCAVLGDPVAHSLSPTMHRAAYAVTGLDWDYAAIRVPEGGLAKFLDSLGEEWRGLSLTMPLKREAMPLMDAVSSVAARAGSANTVIVEDGRRLGDNTDLPGAIAAIRERYAGPLTRTAIWGGGATASSALLAAADLGCREFELFVRDPARAAETLEAAGRFAEPLAVTVRALGEPVSADLLVSTIPALPQESLVDSIERAVAVFEVLYHPWPTPLARWAGRRPLVTGLDLLAHQAALQFTLFTGLPAPLEVMREAGQRVIDERS